MRLDVGSTVTIKVRNPQWAMRKAFANYVHVPEFNEYTGTVIKNHKAIREGQIGLSTDETSFKMRVIDLDRIVGMEDSLPSPNVMIKTYNIQGSKGNIYTVTQDRSYWDCDCPGFRFRNQCKHVDRFKAEAA